MNTRNRRITLSSTAVLSAVVISAMAVNQNALACEEHSPVVIELVPSIVGLAPIDALGEEGTIIELIACTSLENSALARLALLGQDERTSHIFVEGVVSDDGDEGETHEVKVEVSDGKPTIWIDGKKVDSDQLRHENGRIIVLDDNGKELRSVRIWEDSEDGFFGGGRGHWRLQTGDSPFNLRFDSNVIVDTNPPTVMLGVYLDSPGPALRRHLKLDDNQSTLITGVYEGLPAATAGLEEYDIIVGINGDTNAGPERLREVLRELESGDALTLTIIHEGKRQTLDVTLEAYDQEKMRATTLHGHAARTQLMRGELVVSPFDMKDTGPMFVRPAWEKMDFDTEHIERIIEQAMRNAMRHTEDVRRMGAEKLHEHLDLEDVDIHDHMEKLHQRMEMVERLMQRLEEHLREIDGDEEN